MPLSKTSVAMLCLALALVSTAAVGAAGAQFRHTSVKADVFVAEASAGSGSGSSCANARSALFFNTAANWGSGKPIGPGKVVGLCGTISSTLTVQGSGTPSGRITIFFTPGSKLSQPVCGPCLDLDNRSYITVDGGGRPAGAGNAAGLASVQGIIEATENGDTLGIRSPGSGVSANPCSHCVIKNLYFKDLFVRNCSGCSEAAWSYNYNNAVYSTGTDVTISHNKIDNVGWAIFYNGGAGGKATGIHIDHNEISNMDHGFTESGGDVGNIWFNNNYLHNMDSWDNFDNSMHHDGIHCYTIGTPNHHAIDNFYIYNNVFGRGIGNNATAWLWIAPPGNDGCTDDAGAYWVFNNVCYSDHGAVSNACFTFQTGRSRFYNNTLRAYSTQSDPPGPFGGNAATIHATPGAAFENNLLTTANGLIGMNATAWAAGSPDYNMYAHGGNNAFHAGACTWGDNFALWKRCIGGAGDAHSINPATDGLDWTTSLGKPLAGSKAIGAGANLTSLCKGNLAPLCFDIEGSLRPLRMRPDIGAYQRETAEISGRAIGRAAIGESKASIERFYGARRATRRKPLLDSLGRNLQTATYRLHGGRLDIGYAGGKAVAVSTSTRYYNTVKGFGVGAPARRSQLAGLGWRSCGAELARRRGGVVTVVRIARGVVVALALARPAALHCP